MKQPAALFLDIDGTILLSDHSLSPRIANAITALREAGTLVCLATGRAWESLKPFYDQLGLTGPTICYNGAFIVGGPDGDRLHEVDMNEEVARYAVSYAREKKIEMVGFRHSQLVFEKLGPFVEGYYRRTGLTGTAVDFDDYETLDFTKSIFIGDHENLLPVKDHLEQRFGEDVLSITFSSPDYLELMGSGVNKGKGLIEVCRIKGIDVADSAAMGDGWNDLPLLQAAGEGWVMGGASEKMKALFPTDRHVPHSDLDGAAMVMEAMLEGRTPDFSEAESEVSP